MCVTKGIVCVYQNTGVYTTDEDPEGRNVVDLELTSLRCADFYSLYLCNSLVKAAALVSVVRPVPVKPTAILLFLNYVRAEMFDATLAIFSLVETSVSSMFKFKACKLESV